MNTTEPAAELQIKTPTEIYLVLNAGDHGEHLWSDKPVTENGTQNAGPYVLRTVDTTPTEQIRDLLSPYLAKVQALADSRPDIQVSDIRFHVYISPVDKIAMSASVFYHEDKSCITSQFGAKTAEEVISSIKRRLTEIPAPPTREQLIAEARARLAALEGGES